MWTDPSYIFRDRHERFALRRRGREIEGPGISARSTIKGADFQLIKCEDLFTLLQCLLDHWKHLRKLVDLEV